MRAKTFVFGNSYWHMHHILNRYWFSQTCKSLSFRGVHSSTCQLPFIYIDIVPFHSLSIATSESIKIWYPNERLIPCSPILYSQISTPNLISQLRSIMLYVLLVFLNDGKFSAENQGIFGDSATIHRTRFYIFKHSMNSMSYLLPPSPPPPQHASSNFLIHPSTLDFILSHFTLIYLQKNTYKRIRLDINSLCGQKHLFLETQYWHMHHILNWFWFSQTCKSLMIYWEDKRTLQ